MKRVISICLTLLLIITSVPVFANTNNTYPGANELYKNQLIRGDESGNLLVENVLTRAHAATLLSHLYGKFEEAGKFSYSTSKQYNDVKASSWYAPYVGYANANGWMVGTPEGNFEPDSPITRQQWATILLRVLNSFNTWETAERDLAFLGIVISAQNQSKLLRGEAFDAMWAAVNTKPKGSDLTLLVILGKAQPVVLETPELKQVSVPSLRQIKLVFNTALDSKYANDINSYGLSIEQNGASRKVDIKSAVYDDATKSVFLTLLENQAQQSTLNFTLNLLDTKGTKVSQGSFTTISLIDLIPPSVISTESIGTRAIKIVFSEPVVGNGRLSNTDFSISNQQGIKQINLTEDNTVAIIETYSDIKGTITIQPKNSIKDYAGYSVISSAISITATTDKTPPTVVATENVSSTSITFVFNKDISTVNPSGGMFRTTLNSDGSPTIKGKKVTVNFTNNFLPSGQTSVVIAENAVSDYSGVFNKQQVVSVSVPVDNTPPTLTEGIKVLSENKIRLTFSKPLDNRQSSLTRASDYHLFGSTGIEITNIFRLATYNAQTFSIDLETSKPLLGNYRLQASHVKDHSGNVAVIDLNFEVSDMRSPDPTKWTARVYNTGRSDQLIKIRFDEPMQTSGQYSITSPQNYVIKGHQLDKLDQSLLRVEVTENDTSLEIYYPGSIVRGGINFTEGAGSPTSATDIVIGRVADRYGNYTSAFSSLVKLTGSGSIGVEKVEQISANEIKVYLEDTLTNLDISEFVLGNTIFPEDGQITSESDTKSVVLLRFRDPIVSPASLYLKSGKTSNKFGETLRVSQSPISIVDKVGPVIAKLMINGESRDSVVYDSSRGLITMTFNEEIDSKTVSILTFTVPNVRIENFAVVGREIRLTVAPADRQNLRLYDEVRQVFEFRDTSGNATTDLVLGVQKVN